MAGNNPMTAARLEELARRCQLEHYEYAESRETYFDYGDLRALARCARAWATLEKWVQSSSTLVEIIGYRGREHPWAVYPTRSDNRRFTGHTAIEAVEAAEVKP